MKHGLHEEINFLLLLLFFFYSVPVLMAQIPISISKDRDMNFGAIVASSVVVQWYYLLQDQDLLGGIMLPSINGTVSAAQFTVTGEPGFTYAITLPTDFILYDSGLTPSMIVNSTRTPSATGTLNLATGTQTVLVGNAKCFRCSNRRFL
jgi:hypothetical protein